VDYSVVTSPFIMEYLQRKTLAILFASAYSPARFRELKLKINRAEVCLSILVEGEIYDIRINILSR